MPQSELKQAIEEICAEKNIPYQSVIETIAAALAVAYRKDFGQPNENVVVDFNVDDGTNRVFDVKTVVEDKLYDEFLAEQKRREEAETAGKLEEYLTKKRAEEEVLHSATPTTPSEPGSDTPPHTGGEEKEERFDPKKHIALSAAKKLEKGYALGDEIRTELFPPAAYGRMAAQTAKQVVIQRIREAERDIIYKEYKGREGELLTAMVQRVEGRMVLIDLGHTTAIMPPPEQVQRERYRPGDRIKVFLVAVNMGPRGPEILVSRSHPEIVRKLFTFEVPELHNESVTIKSIAREAGLRTKLAVWSATKNIDPVGSLVGQRGTRVQTVISELGGEKVDIIEWSDDPVKYITNALSPAKVISIKLNDVEHSCVAEVKDDQLSLAIGKAGQNVRLAAKLTGWKIDLVGDSGAVPTSSGQAEDSAAPHQDAPTNVKGSEIKDGPEEGQATTVTDEGTAVPAGNATADTTAAVATPAEPPAGSTESPT